MLSLIEWLRELDARFVAAVTSYDPPSEKEARLAAVLGAVGLVLVTLAVVVLPAHAPLQAAAVGVGLILSVPYLHGLFERVLLSVR